MIKLICGDCFNVLQDIEDKSVGLILADLPYGTTRNKWDIPLDLTALWKEYKRIIKDKGCIALWSQPPFDKVLACSNMDMFRYEWIIKKTSPTGFLNAKKMPMKAHENVLIFYKQLPTYNPQKTTGHPRKVSTAEHKRNCKVTTNYGSHGLTTYDSTERYPIDVLEFKWDKQQSRIHPTQKPIAAQEYFIKTYTNRGDLVLDNVMGSGSSAIAAANLDRSYIGIEKDPEIYKKAVERYDEATTERTRCYEA